MFFVYEEEPGEGTEPIEGGFSLEGAPAEIGVESGAGDQQTVDQDQEEQNQITEEETSEQTETVEVQNDIDYTEQLNNIYVSTVSLNIAVALAVVVEIIFKVFRL